ncbi:Rpn family recombination-promoting nuclease/putative transposase [bacterium 1XD8-76]|nr:Rpn family recombination-promoting nuclease/putative transposase [bacterium 1XD8-76]
MNHLKNSDSMLKLASFTGTIDYPLMNDYMFRSVMQSNENVLKGLLCSLLRLDPNNVQTVQILNPIELGKKISDKEFILDIKVLMNDNTAINLEMQINNQYNWPERSLVYLSRLFDGLNAGESYRAVKPAFQIGILNFTPFPGHPEFFSTYKMMNIKNYYKYSDKFTIHVLDLTQIHLADREDKNYDLDKWAKLFRALTWEDFKMISEGNKSMQEAGETLFTLNEDDRIRDLCEAREDYRRTWEGVKQEMDELRSSNEEKIAVIEKKDNLIASLEAQVAELQMRLQSD